MHTVIVNTFTAESCALPQHLMPGILLRVRGEMGCWQTGWEGCSGDSCLQEKKKRWFAELGAAKEMKRWELRVSRDMCLRREVSC